jgi:hypothetical protein
MKARKTARFRAELPPDGRKSAFFLAMLPAEAYARLMPERHSFPMCSDNFLEEPVRNAGRNRTRASFDRTLLNDLIAVLQDNKAGLRRWSVMRAMRTRRARTGHEITPKFEDEVERLFREYCVGDPPHENDTRPFFRPKDKAGEVWAVDTQRLRAFLETAHDRN